MERVLLLNRNYQPIKTITARKAMHDLFSEKAVVVVPPTGESKIWEELTWEDWSNIIPKNGDAIIRSPRQAFKLPEIIRLSEYDGLPIRDVKFSKRAIYKRDKNTCSYCGVKQDASSMTIEHINPKSRGGRSTWENTCLACLSCNLKKADRTPEEAGMELRIVPQKPNYDLLHRNDFRANSWKLFITEV